MKTGTSNLELKPSIAAAGIESVIVKGNEVEITYAGLGGGGVGATRCRAFADGILRYKISESGGEKCAKGTIAVPRRDRVLIGIDDTDSKDIGATWTLTHNIAKKLDCHGFYGYHCHHWYYYCHYYCLTPQIRILRHTTYFHPNLCLSCSRWVQVRLNNPRMNIRHRHMGQRFIPDSYVFSNIVDPYTGEYKGELIEGDKAPFTLVTSGAGKQIRGFPRGLDVMSLLGSERAVYWLDELNDSSYENYSARYEELDSEFSNFSAADWNRNLYWSWLYSLQPLLKDYGSGYPTFMQTDAWQDKELSTSLASWTELRHDTILYAKQSETMSICKEISCQNHRPKIFCAR